MEMQGAKHFLPEQWAGAHGFRGIRPTFLGSARIPGPTRIPPAPFVWASRQCFSDISSDGV